MRSRVRIYPSLPIRAVALLPALGLLCLAPTTAQVGSADPWSRLLGSVGLTRQSARFDELDMASYGGQEFALPLFTAMHRDPLRIPFYARVLRQSALAAAPSCGELAMLGGLRIAEGSRRTLIGDPLAEQAKQSQMPDALALAIAEVYARGGKPLDKAALGALSRDTARVPQDVARAAALLLRAELDALRWRERAVAGIPLPLLKSVFRKLVEERPDDDRPLDPEVQSVMHRIDLKYLLVGGIDLALATDRALGILAARAGREQFNLQWSTPLGRIVLSGAQSYAYASDQPSLLTIDTGGDDRYFAAGATADVDHPVSVTLDLAGNDRYLQRPGQASLAVASDEERKKDRRPGFGAGVLGYGILVDAAGDDLYRSYSNTQGLGCFGVGILQDRGGNDRYDCYGTGQGSARFGVGALADLGGADEYRCFAASQGFGDTKGFGLLVDVGGESDLYEANDTAIDFPSAQTKDHNSSLSQGCGMGRRADYLDAHSLAGGIGVLVDGGGGNRFSCALFGQGAGYWYGAGLLSAGPGDDRYRGIWYVQGASAHFAVGALRDEAGNDDYQATTNMAQGAGHDFGPGFLIDLAGNDRYQAPNLSLGGGNANGFGLFWDRSGDDAYVVSPSTTLGRASIDASGRNSIRERDLTLGLFLDTGGHDSYPKELPWARNSAAWTMADSGPPPLPSARGAGLDTDEAGEEPL